MTLRLLAQNALDGLSDRQTADACVQLVTDQHPDVAVFPEAYDMRHVGGLEEAVSRFKALGYTVAHGAYDDQDGRKDVHGFMLIVRQSLMTPDRPARLRRIAGRNMAEAWVIDPATHREVHVVGVHLNDLSEVHRQLELDDLLTLVVDPAVPTVIAGDFNAVHGEAARGAVIRTTRLLAKLVDWKLLPVTPTIDPRHPSRGLGRIGDLAKRLRDMANGQTMARLQRAGFSDADATRQPTHPARRPFVQLDHIMVGQGVHVQDFAVLPRDVSDHRGIVATIEG